MYAIAILKPCYIREGLYVMEISCAMSKDDNRGAEFMLEVRKACKMFSSCQLWLKNFIET